MSTIFNVRNLKLPNVSRTAVIIGAIVVVLALVAGIVGWQLYKKLTNNTVVAYFPDTLALYPGDKVQIMGVKVGSIDSIEPAGDKMKVTFHYENKYKVPANATASILNPSLVASRTIQLSPPYTGGPEMENNAVIPIDRTQVPVEYDELRDSINRILTDLGPTPEQPKGPFGDVIESFSNGLAGKGDQINKTLNGLSEAVTTLNEGRGDFFAVIKSLALFVNALYKSDQQFVALNNDLAQFTNSFTNTDQELATALRDLNDLLTTTRKFISENGEVLAHDVDNLADVTNAILQPEPLDGLETGLHVFPNLVANLMNIASPNAGGIVGLPVIANFANPMEFICSSIQAGSRLGYQESAELCAQYLAPILDAIKFNFPPIRDQRVHRRHDAAQADLLLRAAAAAAARATRTPPCRGSSRATRCSRTATTSRAGSPHRVCRASRCSRPPRETSRRSVSQNFWADPTACLRKRRPRSGSTTAGCPVRRTLMTSATRCRRRGTPSRGHHRVRHLA